MNQQSTSERLTSCSQLLEQHGQEHILAYTGQLTGEALENLLDEIEGVDWPEVARLIDSHVLNKPEFKLPDNVEPAPYFEAITDDLSEERTALYKQARELGEKTIRQGGVAVFTVAGGQGTRLGFDAPKGTFLATPIKKLSLFEVFAQGIQKTQEKYNCAVPWYVMTSPVNDAATRTFFDKHDYFGLNAEDVMIFPQAMMPAIDRKSGKVLMADRNSIALSPNGHGGSLKALYTSGAIDDMRKRGVTQISYVQVDNPMVKVVDPLFIGLHEMDNAQMSSKMVKKTYAAEKVGLLCKMSGDQAAQRIGVIEYSDLPETYANQTNEDGTLTFNAGSIAIHTISVDFVDSLNSSEDGFSLPFHRAEKKVPYLDPASGEKVKPESPNAVKLETFVFDALMLCDKSIVLETIRENEFAPIKNASGEGVKDSPATSQLLQVDRAARWLEAAGIDVARTADGEVDAVIEVLPSTAVEAEDLKESSVSLPDKVAAGDKVVI